MNAATDSSPSNRGNESHGTFTEKIFMMIRQIFTRKFLWIGFGIAACIFAMILAYFFYTVHRNNMAQVSAVDKSLVVLNQQVHDSLGGVSALANAYAQAFSMGRLERVSDVPATMRSILSLYPSAYGAGVALDSEWVREHANTFGRLVKNARGQISIAHIRFHGEALTPLEIPYDFTDAHLETSQWYTIPARTRSPCWVGPFFGTASQTYLVSYSVPIFDSAQQFMGVSYALYSLAQLRDQVSNEIDMGDGYTVLVNQQGAILYHPRIELMENKQTMRHIGEQTNNETLLKFSDSLDHQSPMGEFSYLSIYTGERTRLKYQRIPDLGWYVLGIIPDKAGQPFCFYQKQIFFFIAAFMLLCILLWCLLMYPRVWLISVGTSVLFTLGIIGFCALSVMKYESGICAPLSFLMNDAPVGKVTRECSRTPLNNAFAASAYMNRCFQVDGHLLSIPTGVVVQTVNFTSANSFSMSGYLWQKYRSKMDTGSLGVEFPENESVEMALAYDDSLSPTEFVRGWRFSTEIRQPFSYKRYPLDKEEIWLRMRPLGLAQNVMLEPDFMSYRTSQERFMGVDENLVVSQWKILNTNFSYANNQTTSNYGKGALYNNGTNPELFFSIHVRRNILDAFVSQFIPLLVIILMLFSILWVGRKEDGTGLLGFDSLAGASGCSALFFIVIYNHISIRNMLGSPGVVYMEFFFFVTYAGILFVSLNSILVAMDKTSVFINYKDNLISRILFWPITTGSLFVATFLSFY